MHIKLKAGKPKLEATANSDLPDPKKLFSGINTALPVIVAVSGGSDSLALLLLASAWANSKNVMLQAVTVDHGLRPEAAAEAAFVAGVCERHDLSHVTLAWEGIKPSSGISDASRKARYTLLEEFAADIGAGTIITGHTADDQAETIAMRLKRDDGTNLGRGLAGMARVTLLPGGIKLVRPLIDCKRRDLRNYLSQCSQSWIEDPSNQDQSYERVRIRQELQAAEARSHALVKFGKVMARFRHHNSKMAAQLLQENAKINAGPVYELDCQGTAKYPEPVIQYALQVIVALAGGMEYLVSASRFSELALVIKARENGNMPVGNKLRFTIGRTIIEGKGNRLLVYREARNLPAVLIGPGDMMLWDGRYAITNETSTSVFVGSFDSRSLVEEEQRREIRLDARPRLALKSTPGIKFDGDEVFFPMVEQRSLPPRLYVKLVALAIEHFCPEWDFPLVEWVRELELSGKNEFMGRSSN